MRIRFSRLSATLVFGGLLIFLVPFLAACGATPATPAAAPAPATVAPEPTAAPEQAAAEEPEEAKPEEAMTDEGAMKELEGELTIAVWGQIDADPNHASYAYHEILQQWNDLHPNVNLKYEIIGGASVPDRFTWIKTHLAAGTLPDIVMIYFPNDDFKDPDLVYDFSEDLQAPNPYSDNPTWWDDFPYDGLILREYAGPDNEYFFVGPTLTGDTGVTTIVYNKDIFDEVGVTPPTNWAEFIEVQQKIKDAGYTPFFQPIAGPLGWLIGWPLAATNEQLLDEVVRACDFEEPKDRITDKELAWCIKTGNFRTDDPRHMESWRLMKEWSPFWQEGFLAPPPEGDPFAQGEVAMQHTMNLWLNRISNNPDITFEWGTFYQPPVTEESTEYATGAPIRRVGNLGAAASGSQFLMIPMTTVEKGKLALALDLAQYTTAPEQLQYWCDAQPIPCFEPGTSIEEVYPDSPDVWVRMRGFFEPGAFQNGVRGFDYATFGQDTNTLTLKLLQDYLGDALTLEEAMAELQVILEDAADTAIREHPEWNAADWGK